MDRRKFLERLLRRMTIVVGGYPLVIHLLGRDRWAALSRSQDQGGRTGAVAGPVKFPGEGATLEGYLAKPGKGGPHPAILLIPANSGLNEHIRHVARRYAEEGFVALAVDTLSRHGGTASFDSPNAARRAFAMLSTNQIQTDLDATLNYLRHHRLVHRDRIRMRRV